MQIFPYKRLFSYPLIERIYSRVLYHADERHGAIVRTTTLQHRFIKHLEKSISVDQSRDRRLTAAESSPSFSKRKELNNSENSSARPTNHYFSFIINDIKNLEKFPDSLEWKLLLITIDRQSCSLLVDLSHDQILLLLNKLMEVVPHKLAGLEVYQKSIEKLRGMLHKGSLKPEMVVNLLFLISLTKKKAARDVVSVLKHLPDMEELSLIEKCIVSTATFKTGVKLDKKNVQTIEDTVLDNLDSLLADPGFLVSLLKAMRYGGPSSELSLNKLSKRILESEKKFDITLAVPILALYAEMLMLERKVVEKLVRDSIYDVNRGTVSAGFKDEPDRLVPVRIKEVDRLLWVVSRLNYRLTDEQLADIEKFNENRLEILTRHPEDYANMLVSLWMLRSPKCGQNVEYCLREKIFEPLLYSTAKNQLRLNLLLECVRIEAPWIVIPPIFKSGIRLKSIRPCTHIETVNEVLKCLGTHLDLYDARVECPIKWIRIYGVSARHEKLGWIHIDTLNNTTCLRNTIKPNGMFDLKLRLVKKMGYFSIILDYTGVIETESMITIIEESIKSELENRVNKS